ncbi:MAG: hypothetical protein QW687_00860 [Candidatus Hadarchaeales archaeon]
MVKKLSGFLSLTIIFVLLGFLGYLAWLKVKPEARKEVISVSVRFSEDIVGAEEYSKALLDWLNTRGLFPSGDISIELHDTLDFPTADRTGTAMVAGILYPDIQNARIAVWTRCEGDPITGGIVCRTAAQKKGQHGNWEDLAKGDYSEEVNAIIAASIADCLETYLLRLRGQHPAPWSLEKFQPLIRREGEKWVSEYLKVRR